MGEYYEVTEEVITKYYGGKTAMRKGTVLTYLLADHLGSNSLIASDSGTLLSETRYKPWGEIRYTTGTTTTPYTYTGQYSNTVDFGWMYYKARWYDSALGRFSQADTIIPRPSNIRSWDRYSYSANNPIRYLDPTGHDWLDSVGGFIQGFIAEVDRSFFGLTPQLQEFYGPNDSEPNAVLIGRMTADILELVGGVAAIGSGLGVGGGGVLACGTGVGCLATPETIVVGAAIIGVGSKAVAEGALGLGQNLALYQNANEEQRLYKSSPKHDPNTGWGSEMGLNDETAQEVLNNGIKDGKKIYGYYEGKVYVFQPDNTGAFHGYDITGAERVPTGVLRNWKSNQIISSSDYSKMLKWGR